MESGNRLTFNYNIKFMCWVCNGECEGIMLQKFVGQVQSDFHIINWVCPRDNMIPKSVLLCIHTIKTWNNPVRR